MLAHLKTAPDGANRQTHRHTDGHGDSMTNSAQWGRVGENRQICTSPRYREVDKQICQSYFRRADLPSLLISLYSLEFTLDTVEFGKGNNLSIWIKYALEHTGTQRFPKMSRDSVGSNNNKMYITSVD